MVSLSKCEVVDIGPFMDRVDNDSDLIKEVVDVFLREAPQLMADLARAAASRECIALRNAAHAIKGCVANFSAYTVVAAAADLENMGRQGNLSGLESACSKLEDEIGRLSGELLRIVKEIQPS